MFKDIKDPRNARLEIQTLQVGRMILQIDKDEKLYWRDARGIDQTHQLGRGDEALADIITAGLRGSGEKPAAPPPDTTRIAPPSNVVDPYNVNASLPARTEARAQYGREVAALKYEKANPAPERGFAGLELTRPR